MAYERAVLAYGVYLTRGLVWHLSGLGRLTALASIQFFLTHANAVYPEDLYRTAVTVVDPSRLQQETDNVHIYFLFSQMYGSIILIIIASIDTRRGTLHVLSRCDKRLSGLALRPDGV